MMRESGISSRKIDEETRAKLEEDEIPRGTVSATTGKLAIKPFLQMSRKDLWQFYVLSK